MPSPGFEPRTAVPKTDVISISPRRLTIILTSKLFQSFSSFCADAEESVTKHSRFAPCFSTPSSLSQIFFKNLALQTAQFDSLTCQKYILKIFQIFLIIFVRRKGIEPLSPAWKAGILPLNQHRINTIISYYLFFSKQKTLI